MTTMGVTTWSHAAAKVGYCSGIYPLRLLFDLAGRLKSVVLRSGLLKKNVAF